MSMIKLAALVLLALLVAGCGEYRQKVDYENGAFQGKQDERVWDSEKFFHDPAVWKQFINERTQRQNEYQRTQDQE